MHAAWRVARLTHYLSGTRSRRERKSPPLCCRYKSIKLIQLIQPGHFLAHGDSTTSIFPVGKSVLARLKCSLFRFALRQKPSIVVDYWTSNLLWTKAPRQQRPGNGQDRGIRALRTLLISKVDKRHIEEQLEHLSIVLG